MVKPEDIIPGQRLVMLVRPDVGESRWVVMHVTVHKIEEGRIFSYMTASLDSKKELDPENLFYTDEEARTEYTKRNSTEPVLSSNEKRRKAMKEAAKDSEDKQKTKY